MSSPNGHNRNNSDETPSSYLPSSPLSKQLLPSSAPAFSVPSSSNASMTPTHNDRWVYACFGLWNTTGSSKHKVRKISQEISSCKLTFLGICEPWTEGELTIEIPKTDSHHFNGNFHMGRGRPKRGISIINHKSVGRNVFSQANNHELPCNDLLGWVLVENVHTECVPQGALFLGCAYNPSTMSLLRRIEAFHQLFRCLASITVPIVLVGDFNPDSELIVDFLAYMEERFDLVLLNREMANPATTTRGSLLDLIYVSRTIKHLFYTPRTVPHPEISLHHLVIAASTIKICINPTISFATRKTDNSTVPLSRPKYLRSRLELANCRHISAWHSDINQQLFKLLQSSVCLPSLDEIGMIISESADVNLPPRANHPLVREMKMLSRIKTDLVLRFSHRHPLVVGIHRLLTKIKHEHDLNQLVDKPIKSFMTQGALADIPDLLMKNDGVVTDSEDRLSYIESHFTNIAAPPGDTHFDADFCHSVEDGFEQLRSLACLFRSPFDTQVTLPELLEGLVRINRGKAVGLDDIPVELLYHLPDTVYLLILACFNNLLNNPGTSFDRTLIETLVSCLVKQAGQPNLLDDRRPITIFNALAKLFEMIFFLRFSGRLYNLLPDNQAAYQPERTPVELLFLFHSLVTFTGGCSKNLYVAFLDLRKAFDALHRKSLFVKLWFSGVNGRSWKVFYDWYDNILTSIRLNGLHRTRFFHLESGVLQGSLLGPLFFLIFILDLLITLQKSGSGVKVEANWILSVLALADDLALFAESPSDLSKLLQICSKWAELWQICFNHSKSGVQVYPFPGYCLTQADKPSLFLSGDKLPWVDRYRYIGFNQSPSAVNGNVGLKGRVNAAKAAANRLLRAFTEKSVRRKNRMSFYFKHIAQVLEYGSEALPLSETQLANMDEEEAGILIYLECDPAPYIPFSTRWLRRRERFLTKMSMAPAHTWRRKFFEINTLR
eukprot:Lithocolla_globosa_v1_NODE_46_length_7973_cov_21.867264.p1 type:complete len:950 gc:universal NODE_46_length_7973_cov_21.867264:4720-7569(+)